MPAPSIWARWAYERTPPSISFPDRHLSMTTPQSIVGIYDFELFPFALGDVLTWNVRTAMRCEDLGRRNVDIYICVDERYPAGVHQRDTINAQNFDLFFSELYSAFGTHPCLGDIHIFRDRNVLIDRLREIAAVDPVNEESIRDYLEILSYREIDSTPNKARRKLFGSLRSNPWLRRLMKSGVGAPVRKTVLKAFLPNEEVINNYFTKYIASHESINAFAAARSGRIPLLQPSLGCTPDIDELVGRRFSGRKIVPFHLRLRRLDAGYKGEHSYSRDSDFLEWYDFLREASVRHPEVEFVALGRLQEKPLELLRLPNVTSLRLFGLGLGHELTLMLRSDLFIGTSSGFAALANFSALPYFITRMNPGSCRAYDIPEGADRLPFAKEDQKLIYATETSELLMELLETGLGLVRGDESDRASAPGPATPAETIDVHAWLNARLQVMNSAATTSRFFADDTYRRAETAYLLYLSLERARQAILGGGREEAAGILKRAERNFPEVCRALPQFELMREVIDSSRMDRESLHAFMEALDIQVSGFVGTRSTAANEAAEGWRLHNWVVSGTYEPLAAEPQPALRIRATAPSSYWHSEPFAASRADGKIVACFEARNSDSRSLHQMYLFEDGVYRPVGQIFAETEWYSYEVPITSRPGCVLEIQIDQPDAAQWLLLRNIRIIGGGPLPSREGTPQAIPMAGWSGGTPPAVAESPHGDVMRWMIGGRPGHTHSPPLPVPGAEGLRFAFEARADRPAGSFAALYLFEGAKYRHVGQYAFGSQWRRFTGLLKPDPGAALKLQIDYPEGVEWMEVRNFEVTPIHPADAAGAPPE